MHSGRANGQKDDDGAGCLPARLNLPASGAEEEGQFSTKSSSTSSSHVSLPLSPPRLVNELVIDSMNWNPNLSLLLILFRRFIDLLWRRIRARSLPLSYGQSGRSSQLVWLQAFSSFPFHSMSKKSKWLCSRRTKWSSSFWR